MIRNCFFRSFCFLSVGPQVKANECSHITKHSIKKKWTKYDRQRSHNSDFDPPFYEFLIFIHRKILTRNWSKARSCFPHSNKVLNCFFGYFVCWYLNYPPKMFFFLFTLTNNRSRQRFDKNCCLMKNISTVNIEVELNSPHECCRQHLSFAALKWRESLRAFKLTEALYGKFVKFFESSQVGVFILVFSGLQKKSHRWFNENFWHYRKTRRSVFSFVKSFISQQVSGP